MEAVTLLGKLRCYWGLLPLLGTGPAQVLVLVRRDARVRARMPIKAQQAAPNR